MKIKYTETAKRIKALRKSLEMNQVPFAEAVGVDQTRISQWEAGSGGPSAEAWLKLGALAAESDPKEALYFWEQTGIDPKEIISLVDMLVRSGHVDAGPLLPTVERIIKQRARDATALERQGDVVLVPPYTEGVWKESQSSLPLLPVPAEKVKNRASTFYIKTRQHTLDTRASRMQRGFVWGDWIVFDMSGVSGRKFGRFVNLPVLVNFTGRQHHPAVGLRLDDPFMGRLAVFHDSDASWVGLESYDTVRRWESPPEFLVRITSFRREDYLSNKHPLHAGAVTAEDRREHLLDLIEAEDKALSTLEVPKGCEIMGRFIALFNGEATGDE